MPSYTYDTRGNRVKEAYTNSSNAAESYNTTCLYDVNNRLLTERKLLTADSTGTINRYYYDKNGNQIKKTTGTYDTMRMTHQIQGAYHTTLGIYGENENSGFTTEKRTYDAFNQLTKVTGNGTALGTYTYLPNGLRLSKTVNGSTKYFLWDGDQIYAELNSNNTVTAQYLYGTERICNTINNNYYMYNNHGDVSDLTDANGNVIRNYNFFGSDAFGDEKNPDSNDTNPFRYCGEYYDTETGYIYLRARYYDPGIGGFITEDPIRDGVNWYSYCMGNPVIFTDSNGFARRRYVVYTNDTSSSNEIKPSEQAEIIAKMQEETYGEPVEVVHVSSSQEFVDWWNNELPDKDIAFLEIISHGVVEYSDAGRKDYGIGSLAFEDGSVFYAGNDTIANDLECNNMSDLTRTKSIDYLYVSACNSANPDVVNIAQAFLDKNPDIKIVGGWDGGVAFVPRHFDVMEYRDMPTKMEDNPTFQHFADC